jgi:tripeptide aminopeptidase
MTYNHPKAVEFFLDMVRVDSPSFQEKNMVDYLCDKIKKLGWDAELERVPVLKELFPDDAKKRLESNPDASDTEQLVVIIPANCDHKPCIYFCAHIDTVKPGNNIQPVEKDGRIYSDGTTVLGSDDKSGVAAIVAAVDEIIKSKEPHGKIILLFTALEEQGHLGAHQIDINKYNPAYGYVFDTHGRVGRIMKRSQHGQTFDVTVQVSNLPNHSYAATVPNSLSLSCDLIAKIEKKLFDKEKMTFTQVTRLTNEYQPGYMVPHITKFRVTTRSFDKKAQEKNAEKIKKLFLKFKCENATLTYDVFPAKTYGYDHSLTQEGRELMKRAEKCIIEMGLEPEYITNGLGGHDASSFIVRGVPSLVLSCGMQEIHTTREFIEIKDLHNCTELILRLIRKA